MRVRPGPPCEDALLKRKPALPTEGLVDDARWYQDAVIYELRVRSYSDSNADGIGDLAGLTEKLDYLQDLGVTALWILPICPSPNRDDGYDISDYCDVQPDLGTLDDFKLLVERAHKRGIRIITELVVNHTSDQHPWFQRARRAPLGSVEREFYVWSDGPDKFRQARIIFKDFESSNWAWDPLARQYYWHRFYSHQPDLNFRSPAVRQAVLDVVDFWFGLGVDGLRLDAVPYLFEAEGTSCENLPETHQFLRELRKHVDEKWRNRMLLAEANQWPEDAAQYFGRGDECHMNFHFPIMPRLFMAIDMADRFPILDILAQTPEPPDNCQWALFLRNHDELTLEMVTDEERDYMYRAYANDPTMRINLGIRRRLAPLVGNDRRRIELMNGLLASLPGTPVLYYGDEIGMGDNVYLGDRNGVRTPMQWSADRNAGFSRANPQKLILPVTIDPEYHYESVNVEAQQNNTSSLLWWTKRLLSLRGRFQAFGRGTFEVLTPDNHSVLAFIRRYGDETILVVANLSRSIQFVELDLSRMKGSVPVELFGRTEFPLIGELPYLLTLGAHAFYWFSLEAPRPSADLARENAYQSPVIEVDGEIGTVLRGAYRGKLEAILPEFLSGRRWYDGRRRELTGVRVVDSLPAEAGRGVALFMLRAEYAEGEAQQYFLPVSLEPNTSPEVLPNAAIARLRESGGPDREATLCDAATDVRRACELLDLLAQRTTRRGQVGSFLVWADANLQREARVLGSDCGRATLACDDEYVLKLARRLGEGVSAGLEIGRFLATHHLDAPVPPLLGAIEYRRERAEPITLATLQRFVPHESSAWTLASQEINRYVERILAGQVEWPQTAETPLMDLAANDVPPEILSVVGAVLESARTMGARIAQLHQALACDPDSPAFAPEPYRDNDRRAMYQSMRNLSGRVLRRLRGTHPRLDDATGTLAQGVLAREADIYRRCERLLHAKLTGSRIRVHGELTLRKLLFTGRDFVLFDFDCDQSRSLAESRRKRCPLRDVATLVRSLEDVGLQHLADSSQIRDPDRASLARWVILWSRVAGAALLRRYLLDMQPTGTVGSTPEEWGLLFDVCQVEVALEEVGRGLAEPDGSLAASLESLLRLLPPA
jgi:maltose alpha-D-glucosyltransferase/alpha-amylase